MTYLERFLEQARKGINLTVFTKPMIQSNPPPVEQKCTPLEQLLDMANCISAVPLADLSDDSAYDALVMILHSSQLDPEASVDERLRMMVAGYLSELSVPVAKPLLDYLKYEPSVNYSGGGQTRDEHKRDSSRGGVAQIISKLDEEIVVPGLLDALETIRIWDIQNRIVRVLMESNKPDAIAGLTELLLLHTDSQTRRVIAEVMGDFPDKDCDLPLILALEDSDTEVVMWSIESLGQLKSKASIPFLAEMIAGDRSIPYRIVVTVINSLLLIGTEDCKRLVFDWCVVVIDTTDGHILSRAIKTLGEAGGNRAIPILVNLLENQDNPILSFTRIVEDTLKEIDTPEALTALVKWYADTESA